jgi:hypothetical protein
MLAKCLNKFYKWFTIEVIDLTNLQFVQLGEDRQTEFNNQAFQEITKVG